MRYFFFPASSSREEEHGKGRMRFYDDPVDGYPKSYPRDDIPKIDHYPGGKTPPR